MSVPPTPVTRGSSPLPPGWQIPDSIRNRIGREAGPQRAIFEEDHLLIMLHEPPAADGIARQAACYWRKPGGDWQTSRKSGPGGQVTDLLEAYEEILLKLETAETAATRAAEFHEILESLGPILRASRGLHRALQQAREFVKTDRDLINYRDRAAAIERTAELILQDAQFGISFIAARQSESQAESAQRMAATAHRLNVLAAIFLPMTAIASVLSMDVRSGLPNTTENFWIIVAGSLGLGLAVAMVIRKRTR